MLQLNHIYSSLKYHISLESESREVWSMGGFTTSKQLKYYKITKKKNLKLQKIEFKITKNRI